jgi:hypothetical protein
MKANISRFLFFGLVNEVDSSSQCRIGDALWDVFMKMNQDTDDDSHNDCKGLNCDSKNDDDVKKGHQRNVTDVCTTIRQFLLITSDRAVYVLLNHIHRSLYAVAEISTTHSDKPSSDIHHNKKRKYHDNDNINSNHNSKNHPIYLESLLTVLPLWSLLEHYSHEKYNEGKNNEYVKTDTHNNNDNNVDDNGGKSDNDHYSTIKVVKNDILSLLQSLIDYVSLALSSISTSTSASASTSIQRLQPCFHTNLGLLIIGALNKINDTNNDYNSASIKNPKFLIMKYICILCKYLSGIYKKVSRKINLHIDLIKTDNVLECLTSLLISLSSTLTIKTLTSSDESNDHSNDTKKQQSNGNTFENTSQSSQNSNRNIDSNGERAYERVVLASEDIQQLLVVISVLSDICSLLVSKLMGDDNMNSKNIHCSPLKAHNLQIITKSIKCKCGYITIIFKNSNISPQIFEKLQTCFFKLTTNIIKISQKLDDYYLNNNNMKHMNRNENKRVDMFMNLGNKIEVATIWRILISCLLEFANLLPSQFKAKIPSLVPPEVRTYMYLYVFMSEYSCTNSNEQIHTRSMNTFIKFYEYRSK